MSKSKNHFKSNKSTSPNSSAESKNGFLKKSKVFFNSEKSKLIFGLSSILFSVFLLLSFTSYLITWQIDQDKLFIDWSEFLFNEDIVVDNWLGKIGALVSHTFIYSWFGVSSFLFVLLTFLVGFKIAFKISLLPFFKTLKRSLFVLFWVSLLLGTIFHSELSYLGGEIGYFFSNWLSSVIGKIGVYLVLIFSLTLFLIISYNFSFDWLISIFQNMKVKEDILSEENQEEELVDSTQNIKTNAFRDEGIIEEFENKEGVDDDSSIDLDVSVAEKSTSSKKEEDYLELDIEETHKEDSQLSIEEINQKVKDFGEYDPTLDLARFQLPSIDLLKDYGDGSVSISKEELENNKNRIVETLNNYKIEIDKIKATIGPTVTLYEIVPAPGVRISKIKNLEDDIALTLAALGIRIIAPIPGKGTIGIEVPNQKPDIVSMRTLIASEKFQNTTMDLPVALGKTISNDIYIADLAKMPHLLMAGATGQGKSVGLNAILVSLLYKKHPSQIKFVLVDPKKVELTLFNKIERHYLAKLPDTEEPIITDTHKVVSTLNSLCVEMDQRYELLKEAGVRTIKEYNAKFISRKLNPENGHKFMPYIVLVVDEFADLIMTAGREVETPIARLAQLARAIGIHLIIATQRPSVNIITGTIKANFPTRIAFRVTSKIDSRTILDAGGADQLIGRGDFLMSSGSEVLRLQCPFVDTPEVEEITEFIGNQQGYPDAFLLPEYKDESGEGSGGGIDISERDSNFEEAARIVVMHQQGSASLLQRKLKLGYNRAGRIIDQLEAAGIIGPFEGSKARQVLISDEYSLEQFLSSENQSSNE